MGKETSNSVQSQVPEETINSFQSRVSEETLDDEKGHDDEVPSFSIDKEMLAKLVEDNSFTSLHQSGGIHGIAAALETILETGISGQEMDLQRRREVFGSNLNVKDNSLLNKKLGHFRGVIVDSIKDTTVILLLCCAILSLVLGIKRNGFEEGILDGAIVFAVISGVACISTIVKFLTYQRNKKLSRRTKAVTVIRDGREQQVGVPEVVVGDIICLNTGDQVPADGLFVHGQELKLDEDEKYNMDNGIVRDCFIRDEIPSMFTGAKVVGGDCRMLVTAVGENTETNKMMKLLKSNQQNKESKLQIEVDKMNSRIEKIWLSLSLLVLAVQVLRCFTWDTGCGDQSPDPDPKGVKNTVQEIVAEATKIFRKQGGSLNRYVEMLSMLVLVTRDGLPLGLLISLAYASKQFISSGAKVRNLPVCGSISLVTTICTAKSSDLYLDHAKMIDFRIGVDNVEKSLTGVNVDVLNALREAIGATSSDSADDHSLLFWAKEVLDVDREKMKKNCIIEAFDIDENRAGFLLKWNGCDNISAIMYWKGSPEIILSMCAHYVDINGALQTLDEPKRVVLKQIIEDITDDSLRCIAFASKKVKEKEEEGVKEDEEIEPTDRGLIWLGLAGLKNPYASEAKQAIEVCGESEIKIKLVLEDDVKTAILMAINSGILDREEDNKEAVVEASVFRNSSEEARLLMVDKIRVMANASPLDKLLMVKCLKQKGEVVAVTGMCTRDSPSLKEADVGFLMGERSAEVAKENSDIIILDNKFATIVDILKLGRSVSNNIRKFIQLHLTVNIAAFTINLVATPFLGEVPIQTFQLLWVNVVMDILGALALAAPISPPARHVNATPLITKNVWRNIVVQVLYQVSVLLTIQFKGKELLLHANQMILKAIVFNSFVLCQVFVLMNAREIEKPNILEGKRLHQNLRFLVILGLIFILQIAIIEIVTTVTQGKRLNIKQWCVCTGIAVMSQPIGLVTKWIISWPEC
ncbi:Calcium-transporting ATPase [Melia azedarach]|uniref:Calcium-transporting ATPase n=1 Tax=Melia azedarach TaxID=155640 RepID=A0ACC1YRK1_MELAZ|nr:Calcium-transporting ATPase [Melia azedarach]